MKKIAFQKTSPACQKGWEAVSLNGEVLLKLGFPEVKGKAVD